MRIRGFAALLLLLPVAGCAVVVESTTHDQAGRQWQAHGSFTADARGEVDLDRAAPTGGTYEGPDGMGLFWSMEPPTGDPDDGWFVPPPLTESASFPVRLTVRGGSGDLARRELTRQRQAHGVTGRGLTVAQDGVVGSLLLPPAGSPRRPGVVVLSGSDGSVPTSDAALLASHGFPALAVGHFNQPGVPKALKDIPVEYVARAARLLRAQPGVDPDALVVEGYSRGTEMALLAAQHHPELIRGVVLYAPNDVAWRSFPDGAGAAWTVAGEPSTVLPVDRISGPVLAVAGGADALWEARPQAERIMARLDAARHRFPHEVLTYPAAGHGVGSYPYLPGGIAFRHPVTGEELALGGTRATNAADRADSWPKVLAFLDELPAARVR
jgi:dienelactone hydrolase